MSNKETNIAEAAKKPDTLILLEKMFAEVDVILHPIYNTLFYFMYNRTDKDKHYRLLIEVFENSFFIKITDLDWHKVSMDNIEEVTKIHSAINKFNRESRAKVFYKRHDDGYMTLSTIMYCPVFEEIPDFHRYFNIQLETLTDAREYVLSPEKIDNILFWDMHISSQPKSNKDIILEALEKLHCVPEVQIDEETYCSIIFEYQEEYFVIEIWPTFLTVKIDALNDYVCDFDIDMLSAVRDLTNEMKWDFTVPFDYEFNNSSCDDKQYIDVRSFVYLPCVEGKCFKELLRETFRHCFNARNKFRLLWTINYAKW